MNLEFEPFIMTASGRRFYALADQPDFRIEDIAAALSKVCRYGGHCRHFYSVAEHSVLVSSIMESWDLGDPREGLLHDGTEAYLSDVVGPFKQLLPDYVALEAGLDAKLRRHFGIGERSAGCKRADRIALMVEGRSLLPERGESMIRGGIPAEFGELADKWIEYDGGGVLARTPASAEQSFLIRHYELSRKEKFA